MCDSWIASALFIYVLIFRLVIRKCSASFFSSKLRSVDLMGDLIYICMRSLLNFNSVLAKIVICDVGGEECGKKQRSLKCYGSCYQTLVIKGARPAVTAGSASAL